MNVSHSLRMTVFSALFAALMAAGAFMAIPIGPVPIVLQNMFVLMAGLVLGLRWGTAAVLLYLFMGLCGFPIFAGGTGGIGRILGPTGGYLLGYIPAVMVCALIGSIRPDRLIPDLLAMTVGSLVVYAVGVPWLKQVTGMNWEKTLAVGMLPFLIGDLFKIMAGTWLARRIRRTMAHS